MIRVGIDLGGSKIEILALSNDGEELFRRRVATSGLNLSADTRYDHILELMADLVSQVSAELGDTFSLGVGTPGSVSTLTGAMKNCNSTCINGRYLQRDLESILGRPLSLANDANCFALSEAVDGAGAGLDLVFGVILGTGVGGGLVVRKELLQGPSNIGSEWGHNLLPGVGLLFENEQRACYCGRSNCVETYLSGPGLVETYRRISGYSVDAQLVDAKAVVKAADNGEKNACKAVDCYQQQLAYSLSQLINVLDPDAIVLGGGVSNMSSLYRNVPEIWLPHVFSDTVRTKLLPAVYGDSSGVRGAAWLPDGSRL